MEVNKLTYKIYKFLDKRGWQLKNKEDTRFIFLIPNEQVGLPDGFELKLPISNKSNDFYEYSNKVLLLLSEIYQKNDKEISELIDLNEKLKKRFTKQWIIHETKSQIKKIGKFDIYIPLTTL
jgi:hypothetical protein